MIFSFIINSVHTFTSQNTESQQTPLHDIEVICDLQISKRLYQFVVLNSILGLLFTNNDTF